MDQPQTGPAATPPPASSQPPAGQPGQPAPQKMSSGVKVLLWLVGGCLTLAILGVIVAVAFTWWGARKVKQGVQKYTPDMEKMKENADKLNQESEEWQKKSQEFRDNMTNPEELQNQIPANPNDIPQR